MAKYQTTGKIKIPLVTMHTTLDPVIPYWHEILYKSKVLAEDSSSLTQISVARYGHCAFYSEEMLLAFNRLLGNAGGTSMDTYLSALPNQALPGKVQETDPAVWQCILRGCQRQIGWL